MVNNLVSNMVSLKYSFATLETHVLIHEPFGHESDDFFTAPLTRRLYQNWMARQTHERA